MWVKNIGPVTPHKIRMYVKRDVVIQIIFALPCKLIPVYIELKNGKKF